MARYGSAALFLPALVLASFVGVAACSKEQPSTKPAVAAPKVEETVKEAPADDIPPPPPEPEDAGVVAAPSGPAIAPKGPVVPDICSPRMCSGQLTEDLADALATKCRVARRCYETELANNPELKGRVSTKVRIASDGTVCNSKVESDETGDARLSACVASMFRGKVPSPGGGGCIETVVPCNFVRGGH